MSHLLEGCLWLWPLFWLLFFGQTKDVEFPVDVLAAVLGASVIDGIVYCVGRAVLLVLA